MSEVQREPRVWVPPVLVASLACMYPSLPWIRPGGSEPDDLYGYNYGYDIHAFSKYLLSSILTLCH